MKIKHYSESEFKSIISPEDSKKAYIQNVRMCDSDIKLLTVVNNINAPINAFNIMINAMIQPEVEMYLKQMLVYDKRLAMHSACHSFIAYKAMSSYYNKLVKKDYSYFDQKFKIINLPHCVDEKMNNCFKNTNPNSEIMTGYEFGHPANELDTKRIKTYPFKLMNFINEKIEFHESYLSIIKSNYHDHVSTNKKFRILGISSDNVDFFISSSFFENDETFEEYSVKIHESQVSVLSFCWYLMNSQELIESIILLANEVEKSSKKNEAMSIYSLESIIEYYTYKISNKMSSVLRSVLVDKVMIDEYINCINEIYGKKDIKKSLITQLSINNEFEEVKFFIKEKSANFTRSNRLYNSQYLH